VKESGPATPPSPPPEAEGRPTGGGGGPKAEGRRTIGWAGGSKQTSRTLGQLGLASGAGILGFLGYVGFGLVPLIFVCLVPLLFAVADATPARAFWLGAVFGLAGNLGALYWVVHLLVEFADLSLPLAMLACGLLCVYCGLIFAVAMWIVRRLALDGGVAPAFSLALALPAIELGYPLIFPYFLGNALYTVPVLTQVVELTGVPGLTALVAVVNGALYEAAAAALGRRRLARGPVVVALAAVAACAGYGLVRIPAVDRVAAEARKIRVAVVQTNVGAREKGKHPVEVIQLHQRMSREAEAARGPFDLVVWPETAYDALVPRAVGNVRVLTEGVTAPVVLGTLVTERRPAGALRVFNSVLLASGTGEVLGSFDKVELLVFGETLPFVETFPSIREWFPRTSVYDRGTTFRHLRMADGTALLPMICYEDIHPALVRRLWRADGPANVLVNVTNDSWYGDTREPRIHLALASFRSIETRRAMIRSTNTGISAIVDPVGRIVKRTGQWTRETLVAEVPVISDGSTTPYLRVGDAYGWLSGLAILALLVGGHLRRRRG
jgi:apolipoprotein N-acyltransferase